MKQKIKLRAETAVYHIDVDGNFYFEVYSFPEGVQVNLVEKTTIDVGDFDENNTFRHEEYEAYMFSTDDPRFSNCRSINGFRLLARDL